MEIPIEPSPPPAQKSTSLKVFGKKYKEALSICAGIVGFVIILTFLSFMFSGNNQEEADPNPPVQDFTIPEDAPRNTNPDPEQKTAKPDKTPFLYHPNAAELLNTLEGMSYQQLKEKAKELPGLRVMWPAFFFKVTAMEHKTATILFDASADGFGAMFQTEINIEQYQEFITMKQGTKVWIAAEITGVDPTGTGRINLKTEYVRFDDFQPPSLLEQVQKTAETHTPQDTTAPPTNPQEGE